MKIPEIGVALDLSSRAPPVRGCSSGAGTLTTGRVLPVGTDPVLPGLACFPHLPPAWPPFVTSDVFSLQTYPLAVLFNQKAFPFLMSHFLRFFNPQMQNSLLSLDKCFYCSD